MGAARRCRVVVKDLDGIEHAVEVSATTLFEAAASAIAAFREHAWAAQALTPNAILSVEVRRPPIVHRVPLGAVERWAAGPSVSPNEVLVKRRLRASDDRR